jgi:hypothetical protein
VAASNPPINAEVAEGWHQLLIANELARNYPEFYAISSGGLAGRNPILDHLLPSLLYVKMVTILDAALDACIEHHQLIIRKPLKEDLNGRICTLQRANRLLRPSELHRIRVHRNKVSHTLEAQSKWVELDVDMNLVESELLNLNCVNEHPKFDLIATQEAAEASDEPGVACVVCYNLKLTNRDKTEAKFHWYEKFYKDDEADVEKR